MRVLVTGANGFIGESLCRHLAVAGFNVVAGLRSETPDLNWAEKQVYGNLEMEQKLSAALEGIDAIVHLAARAHIMRETAANLDAIYRRANTEVTKKIATEAARVGVRRFVFLSSVKVNGEETQNEPYSERSDPAPKGAYGKSKLAAELALQQISENTELVCTSIRVPLVYGPGVGANFGALLRSCELPIPLPLGAITNNRRSLLFSGNLNTAIQTILEHPIDQSGIFLLSDGENLSTADLVRRLRHSLSQPVPDLKVPASMLRACASLLRRKSAADRLCGNLEIDSSRFRQAFNWIPAFTVDQGIAATAAWQRSRHKPSSPPTFK